MPNEFCLWCENEKGLYETDCNNLFEFLDGTPTENKVKFCCYCGRPCVDIPFEEVP